MPQSRQYCGPSRPRGTGATRARNRGRISAAIGLAAHGFLRSFTILVTIFASIARWARYRADTRRLLQFSHGEFSDIGLSRGDIEAAVHGRLRFPG